MKMKEELQKLLEIDIRHNELLNRLEELDLKVLAVLDEWTQSDLEHTSQSESLVSFDFPQIVEGRAAA